MPRVLEIAMRTAMARGGVGVVVIPGNLFFADVPSGSTAVAMRPTPSVIRPGDGPLAAAAEVLNAASRVTILAGAGCAGAHDQLIAIAGALKAPVLHAFRGKEFVEYDNPFDVGMTGLIGFSSGYRAMEHCDALLMLGTDFPYRPFYPSGVPVIQVDVRGEQIGRRVHVDVPLVGTVADTVDALLPLIKVKSDSAHLDRMTGHYKRARSTAGQARAAAPGPLAAAPAGRRRRGRPARRAGRGLHRRRGHALHLGRPLPADERQPPADRLVQPRIHGQRAPAGHRRARLASRAGRWSRCPATAGSRCCSVS